MASAPKAILSFAELGQNWLEERLEHLARLPTTAAARGCASSQAAEAATASSLGSLRETTSETPSAPIVTP